MKRYLPRVMLIALALFYFPSVALSADVPIDCDPAKNCKPIDPCELAPERCKDQGGPISSKKDTSADIQRRNKPEQSDDSCKWCEPCSPTPGSSCLKCCAK